MTPPPTTEIWTQPVEIPLSGAGSLRGTLQVPSAPRGIVLFVHGSGSSRLSPRNRAVAAILHEADIATLLFDLLTDSEALDRARVFDIALLTHRLQEATAWVRRRTDLHDLPLGYFGASTGAAAALTAAADPGSRIEAIVSRGGRPDLASGEARSRVLAPTLCIVGSADHEVVELNVAALRGMPAIRELVIIPGATHLFEEPGTLGEVARLAAQWFARYFDDARRRAARPSAAFAAASLNEPSGAAV